MGPPIRAERERRSPGRLPETTEGPGAPPCQRTSRAAPAENHNDAIRQASATSARSRCWRSGCAAIRAWYHPAPAAATATIVRSIGS